MTPYFIISRIFRQSPNVVNAAAEYGTLYRRGADSFRQSQPDTDQTA